MENVAIKFRGETDSGDLVYGYYVPWSVERRSGVFAVKEKVAGYAGILTDGGDLVAVKADTVKQLCGYDADGCELYEDDETTDFDGSVPKNGVWVAKLSAAIEHVPRKSNITIGMLWRDNYRRKLSKKGRG